ncbi:MAG: hypothetical protein JRI55_36225 [Deltaproteobacteria bacterium]|jgi:hypothetical protein|nr:hypothetical protein [Deltaproteobacteria bacterium]
MTTSIAVTTLVGSTWWPTAKPGGVPEAGSTPMQRRAASRVAVDALTRARAGTPTTSPALDSALSKLRRFSSQVNEAGVESAVALLMVEQSRQCRDRIKQATLDVRRHFARLKQRNLDRLAQIRRRVRARRASAKWGLWSKILKAVGAALSAASSICTGPAGLVGAGLLLASLTVSLTVKDEAGKWIAVGLSLAAAATSLGTGLLGTAATGSVRAARCATALSARVADAAVHGCAVGEGSAQRDATLASAEVLELEAVLHRLRGDAATRREELELMIEADGRCIEQLLRILETTNRTTLTATAV